MAAIWPAEPSSRPWWQAGLESDLDSASRVKERGAHGGCDGGLGELGEGLTTTGGRRRSRGRGGEDGGAEGDAEGSASHELTERRGEWRRSSWACPGGEGEAVAAVVLVGGDGCVRVDAREGDRGGDELEGEVEASRGCRGAV